MIHFSMTIDCLAPTECIVFVGNTRNFSWLWRESQRSRPCHATWARVLALAWQEGRWGRLAPVHLSVSPHICSAQAAPARPGSGYLTVTVLILRHQHFHFRHSFILFTTPLALWRFSDGQVLIWDITWSTCQEDYVLYSGSLHWAR